MLPEPQVITNGIAHGLIGDRLGGGTQPAGVEKPVNRFGMQRGKEFSLGIRPTVFDRAGDVNRSGRNQRDQFMLIDGKVVYLVGMDQ